MFFKDFSCECQKNVVPLLQEKIKKRRYAKYGHDRGCTVYRRCCNRIHMVQVQSRYRLAHYASEQKKTAALKVERPWRSHSKKKVERRKNKDKQQCPIKNKQKPTKPFECFRSRCSLYKLPLKPACKQASRQLLLSISTTLRVQSTQRHKPKKQIVALEISP